MLGNIMAKLKETFGIEEKPAIDFSNIDRNNPPIFGPEDIFEDIYDEDIEPSEILLILILLVVPIAAMIFSFDIFFDCIASMKTPVFCIFNIL